MLPNRGAELGDAAHDARADQACETDRQVLPQLDECLIAGIFRAQVLYAAAAHIVLPFGRESFCAPLPLEAIGAASLRRAAEVKALLFTFDGPLEQLPV